MPRAAVSACLTRDGVCSTRRASILINTSIRKQLKANRNSSGQPAQPVALTMSTYPLYDSNLQLFRLSPLYNGSSPILENLHLHARRLKSALTGQSSLNLGLATPLPSNQDHGFGTLKTCAWELLGDESQWQSAHADEADDDEISMAGEVSPRDARGVLIELEYEKAKQSAILLGEPNQKTSVAGFTNLPLLLVCMPVPVREIFFKYLTTSFDCHVSSMKLRSSFLGRSLEKILDGDCATGVSQEHSLKSLQLQLSFPSASPSLKSIDISINKDDLSEFLDRGKRLWQERSSSSNKSDAVSGPLTAALCAYLQQHIALGLDHPGVVVSRFSYGAFVVYGEGKIKVIQSSAIAKDFWEQVINETNRDFTGSNDAGNHSTALQEKNFQSRQSTPHDPHVSKRKRSVKADAR